MSLRKAGVNFIGGKFFLFGETGSGKSMMITTFPKIAIIDTETGFSEYETYPNVEFVENTTSFKEIIDTLEEINDEYIDKIETFAVDSETNIHNSMNIAMMDVAEKKALKAGKDPTDANVQIRGFGKIKNVTRKIQLMKIDLSSKGKFIVSTAQKGDITKMIGDKMVKIGEKAESHKSLPYDYDIILRLFVEKTKVKGKEVASYKAEVIKDRTTVTSKYDIIENPSFKIWEKHYADKKKMGKIEPTDYHEAENKDIEYLEQEEESIKKSKILLKKLIAQDKKLVIAIFKKLKIAKTSQINTLEIANEIIEYCNDNLSKE